MVGSDVSRVQPCFQLLRMGSDHGAVPSSSSQDLYTFLPDSSCCTYRLGARPDLCDVPLPGKPGVQAELHAEREPSGDWRVKLESCSNCGDYLRVSSRPVLLYSRLCVDGAALTRFQMSDPTPRAATWRNQQQDPHREGRHRTQPPAIRSWRSHTVSRTNMDGIYINEVQLHCRQRIELCDGDLLRFQEGPPSLSLPSASPDTYFLFQRVHVRPLDFCAITSPRAQATPSTGFTPVLGTRRLGGERGVSPHYTTGATVILNSIGSISKMKRERMHNVGLTGGTVELTKPPTPDLPLPSRTGLERRSSRRKAQHKVLCELEEDEEERQVEDEDGKRKKKRGRRKEDEKKDDTTGGNGKEASWSSKKEPGGSNGRVPDCVQCRTLRLAIVLPPAGRHRELGAVRPLRLLVPRRVHRAQPHLPAGHRLPLRLHVT
ncbi:unnamed protein product [Ranitomeya imitator]|uniref:FHA domain-containing protein n=1 Tax=Ranitomeya imitator TaxID=111125 RepID=A0ABN9LRI9_9NEOB|nr:unnamed protein product [Ranitomeya imitator]